MAYTPPTGNAANFALVSYTIPAGDSANFQLASISAAPFPLGFCVSKKLGRPDLPDPLNVFGIWQMRMTKRGKVPIKIRFYTQTNPRTELQQANRAKFAAAMAAWQGLTSEEKATYDARARPRQMFGRNLFIREYYAQN